MQSAYDVLEGQVRALLAGESDFLANAGNFAAFVFYEIPEVNWAGFYFGAASGDLVLGPFCGRPACTRLPAGRGVCGAAVVAKSTIVVDDVHTFAEHIACDSASASEIAVPCFAGDALVGVFDVDSPRINRFTPADRVGIERLVGAFTESVRWPPEHVRWSQPTRS